MNRYIMKSLEPGEEIIYDGRLHWSYIFGYIFWAVILVLAAIGVLVAWGMTPDEPGYAWLIWCVPCLLVLAVIVGLWGRVVRTRTEFVVTRTRFIQKDGIFNVDMKEISLYKLETVNFRQTMWQRIIGTGSIELVGSGGTPHRIEKIANPMEVRKSIMSTINDLVKAEAVSQKVAPQPAAQPAAQPAPQPAPELAAEPAPQQLTTDVPTAAGDTQA